MADTELSYVGEQLEKGLVINAAATLWCCGASGQPRPGEGEYVEFNPEEFIEFFKNLYSAFKSV